MHISQFIEGEFIRHSEYKPGQYAVVLNNDTELVNGMVTGKVQIRRLDDDADNGVIIVDDRASQWNDSEWAEVTPQWFHSYDMPVPDAVAALHPDE